MSEGNEMDLDKLKSQLDGLQKELNDLNERIILIEKDGTYKDSMKLQIDELKETLAPISLSVKSLESGLKSLEGKVLLSTAKYEKEINPALAAIELFKTKLNDINDLKSQFENISSDVKKQAEVIDQLNDSINNLRDSTGNLTGVIDDVKGQLTSKFDELKTITDEVTGKITSLETKVNEVSEFSSQFNQLKEQLNDVTGKITLLKDDFTELEPVINNLKKAIENHTVMFQKVEAKVDEKLAQLIQDNENNKIAVQELSQKLSNFSSIHSRAEETMKEMNETLKRSVIRIRNLESKVGITTGEQIASGYDSQAIFKQILTELLPPEQSADLSKKDFAKPLVVIDTLKKAFKNLCYIDDHNIPDTVEILLKYTELEEDPTKKHDRRSLILNFNKDIRRLLEGGQGVLMNFTKKTQTRRILEETKNIARKWTSEDDLRSPEYGVLTILDLLSELENEFSDT